MQDDFDGGAGIPDDELGGGPVETGEPMGMPELEGEGEPEAAPAAPAGRRSGGARRKSSGARKSSGSARKSGGARKAAKGAKKGGGKKKTAKKAAKKKPARKAGKKK